MRDRARCWQRKWLGWRFLLGWVLVLGIALSLRSEGLLRGLEGPYTYHPDETKQVAALSQFLNGYYVWYTGSLFYDGYPYGLNHVDEWVLRPVLKGLNALRGHLGMSMLWPGDYRVNDLFVPGRLLRVVYGVLCVWLTYLLAAALGLSKRVSLGAAFLIGIAPLSVTVAHFVTGDIGTDLFACCALLALCVYGIRRHWIWMFVAGAATGAAFACKYNGALVGVAIVLFVLLDASARRSVWTVLIGGVTSAAGFVMAALCLTPAFFINPHKTLEDMGRNFRFIQTYGVDHAFLAMPWQARFCSSWVSNTPRIAGALGVALLVLAAGGAIQACVHYARSARASAAANERGRVMSRLRVGIFWFPFVALAISLSGKPEVQPFHFSFLLSPLIVAAMYAVVALWSARRLSLRILALGLVGWWVWDASAQSRHDGFFWAREDNQVVRTLMPAAVLRSGTPHTKSGVIKSIALEDENPSVFRNRYVDINAPSGAYWGGIDVLPIPVTPYPQAQHWVFANGPIFPRSDRMLMVERKVSLQRDLVFSAQPDTITLGLRTGWEPLVMTVTCGADEKHVVLGPEQSRIITVSPRRWKRSVVDRETGAQRFIVGLRCRPRSGQGWITLLNSDVEVTRYKAFNGSDAADGVDALLDRASEPDLITHLEGTRFLEPREDSSVHLNAASRSHASVALEPAGFPLEAGRYALDCTLLGVTTNAEIMVQIDDGYGSAVWAGARRRYKLTAGENHLRLTFDKPATPYQCLITMHCTKGQSVLQSWRLTPDYAAIIPAIRQWRAEGAKPTWLDANAPVRRPNPSPRLPIGVDGTVDIVDIEFPQRLQCGDSLMVHLGAKLQDTPLGRLSALAMFIHLLDEDGRPVYVGGLTLQQSLAAQQLGIALNAGVIGNVPEGEYAVRIGVWNTRTGKRVALRSSALSKREHEERYVEWGTVQVVSSQQRDQG